MRREPKSEGEEDKEGGSEEDEEEDELEREAAGADKHGAGCCFVRGYRSHLLVRLLYFSFE